LENEAVVLEAEPLLGEGDYPALVGYKLIAEAVRIY
jgi:hypothetical protein